MTNYLHYKRQLAVLDENNSEIESWITVRGNHIPIKKGQSKEDAVKSFLEKKGGGSEKETRKSLALKIADLVNPDKISKEEYARRMLEGVGVLKPYSKGDLQKEYERRKSDKEKVDKSTKAVKNYKNTMSKIRNFKAKSDGTYDFETGKPKDYPDGYSVSFHQNEPDAKGNWKSDYGRYSDEDYDKNVSDMVKETGGELNIGYFAGTPEVSVWVKDFKTAVKMAKKHNQHSIWDWKAGDVWINPDYDPKKNPMKQ